MKNWNRLEADINLIMNKHYTPGHDGNRITKIVVHHNCGNLTTRGCYDVWQNREASAHYQVEGNGTIGQLVWDSDTAWHAGNWEANATSIGSSTQTTALVIPGRSVRRPWITALTWWQHCVTTTSWVAPPGESTSLATRPSPPLIALVKLPHPSMVRTWRAPSTGTST